MKLTNPRTILYKKVSLPMFNIFIVNYFITVKENKIIHCGITITYILTKQIFKKVTYCYEFFAVYFFQSPLKVFFNFINFKIS